MAITDPDAKPHQRASMILVPAATPGVQIVRDVATMEHPDAAFGRLGGHAEILYEDVRVPDENLLGARGAGFALAQGRLVPGRIHHCMRWLGVAARVRHAVRARDVPLGHGSVLADKQTVQNWIADSAAQMQAARLMTLHAAWKIDTQGPAAARTEVSMIKYFGAQVLHDVIDRAVQVHGSLGYSTDMPLEAMYRYARGARLYDGPDEVHRESVARQILRGYEPPADGVPSEHVPTRRAAARLRFAELLDVVTSNDWINAAPIALAIAVIVLATGLLYGRRSAAAMTPTRSAARAKVNTFEGARVFVLLSGAGDEVWRTGLRPAARALAVRLRDLMPCAALRGRPGHPGPAQRRRVGAGQAAAIVVVRTTTSRPTPLGSSSGQRRAAGTVPWGELARTFDGRAAGVCVCGALSVPATARRSSWPRASDAAGPLGSKAYVVRYLTNVRPYPARLDRREARAALAASRGVGLGAVEQAALAGAVVWVGCCSRRSGEGAIMTTHAVHPARYPGNSTSSTSTTRRGNVEDTLDKVSPRSLDAVGEAVYRLVARLRRPG